MWEPREKCQLLYLHDQILPLWEVLQWSYRTKWSSEDTKGIDGKGDSEQGTVGSFT